MLLYLLRHGDAPYDATLRERALSPRGEQETTRVIAQRAVELTGVKYIICSPSRRARETLTVVRNQINVSAELVFDDCLRSGGSVAQVEAFLGALCRDSRADVVLLVSHQPLVGEICHYLLDDNSRIGFLETSNLAAFELITFARGCGKLLWLDTP